MSGTLRLSDALPLVVAVTGHRDLVPAEVPGIRREVQQLFEGLRQRYPERRLRVVSGLAEGADRLVADVALTLDIDLIVALPMAAAVYLDDFHSEESKAQFHAIRARAADTFELPLARGAAPDDILVPGTARSRQYAQLGVFLCAHCHILLALWDGKPGGKLGGTAQVVKFHHDDIMPGYTAGTAATQQMLVDDESDLVYHVVCSRNRPGGAPFEGMQPQSACWFTKDPQQPRSSELPVQHRLIFEHSGEFSRDAARYAADIEAGSYALYNADAAPDLPDGVAGINRVFCVADVLAIRFQGRYLRTLRVTHVLAFLMGLSFILYSDVATRSVYMLAFLAFFCASAGMHLLSRRRGWHRKYLDYRALAEGLRVQFYWAVAGINREHDSKFTHDNFLQTQDPELGWIRNVMRVAGMRCDVNSNMSGQGLRYVIDEWIGDAEHGQLGYFARKMADRMRRHRLTERLGKASLLLSVAVVLLLVAGGTRLPPSWATPLMVLMGATLLLFGIRQGYAYATAEKDLIKQYDFMLRIFRNARRRLDNTADPLEQRQILRALGGSALDEHAEWILMHRDRSIDQGEIWRMGS